MSSLVPSQKSTLTIKRKSTNNTINTSTITPSLSTTSEQVLSSSSPSLSSLSTPSPSSSSQSDNVNVNNNSFSLLNKLLSSSSKKQSSSSSIIPNNNNQNKNDEHDDIESDHDDDNNENTNIENTNIENNTDDEEEIKKEILKSKSMINKLNQSSIHRICSGQVIISLTSVIKELIENSLDASSTFIEIKFTKMGLDCIEVFDNGIGISKNNFENIVKKHNTSKLSKITDLESVTTFGFRGEALSSISCMAELQIFTKTENDKLGNLIFYDHDQNITKIEQLPRSKNGTTIKVLNLFKNFPVRFKDFEKNLKREFSKCINIVYSYSLINNITFIVSNNFENIFTSHGKSLKDNYVSIFGLKDFKKLQKVEFIQNIPHLIKINGFISLPEKGCGRSLSDRQFLYVNNRPVDLPKINKCINEIYKEFNRNQYPIFVFNITINSNDIDINVTPDKRTIFILSEQGIIQLLQYELNLLLDPNKRIYNLSSELSPISINSNQSQQSNEKTPISLQSLMINNNLNSNLNNLNNLNGNESSNIINDSIFDINMKNNKNNENTNEDNEMSDEEDKNNLDKNKKNKNENTKMEKSKNNSKSGKIYDKLKDLYENESSEDEIIFTNKTTKKVIAPKRKLAVTRIKFDDLELEQELNNIKLIDNNNNFKNITTDNENENNLLNIYKNKKRKIEKIEIKKNIKNENETKRIIKKENFLQMKVIGQFNKSFIIALFGNDMYILDQHACDEKYNYEKLKKETKFNTQPLINPIKLSLTISQKLIIKDYLNLFEKNGFIIKILNEFENNLNENSNSNLNNLNENTNLDINSNSNENFYLCSLPHSKNITFTIQDFEEYISLLNESTEHDSIHLENLETIRPSKVDKIFASRACRKSTMFGDILTLQTMEKIVKNLNVLNHPWNCPHGRATMRALAHLSFLNTNPTPNPTPNSNSNLDNDKNDIDE